MTEKVYITGIGIISAIGINLSENFNSLINLKQGVGSIDFVDTIHKNEFPCGEIKLSNNDLAGKLDIKIDESFSRTALLGMIAAKEALISSGINKSKNLATGLISANTVGGMDRTEMLYRNINDKNKNFIISHVSGDSTERIADYLGITDYVSTISTACSSSVNSIMTGAEMIKNNLLDSVIAGGTDALSKFTINGFNSLMILDRNQCRPFDNKRNGLNLGEGAAFLVLESEAAVNGREDKIICELGGYANANDAFHQTASSDEGKGAFLSMSNAISMSGLDISDIDYINAHGTGTHNNDSTEATALKKLFGEELPPFSSTKPYTGHTLGAAGVIESVFSILAMKNNIVFPGLNFSEKMEGFDISPVKEIIKNIEIKNVLSNSFGFGGNDSSIIFSKV